MLNPQHSTITVSKHNDKMASGGSYKKILIGIRRFQVASGGSISYSFFMLFENDLKKLPIRKKFLFLSFPTQSGNCINGNALTGSAIQKSHR